MNEEQAILDFFSQAENLPLALSVAELMDELREQMNNQLWKDFQIHMEALITQLGMPWRVKTTKDKNSHESLVGVHCSPKTEQPLFLSPMIEQQSIGKISRVYLGLMWNTPASSEHIAIPAVNNLKSTLQDSGFKNNENFLAWQWTKFYPRRKDFLMGYHLKPQRILEDMASQFNNLLVENGMAIVAANEALNSTPRSTIISLNQLRKNLD